MDSAREPEAGQEVFKRALDHMWIKFLPLINERVDLLKSAAAALAANRLSIEAQAAAHSAAHKLAGALGTFGLDEGTTLAREAEFLYADTTGLDPASAARLIEIASRLGTVIESRR
jgi:chemotaxis protein histidine kinase CheA